MMVEISALLIRRSAIFEPKEKFKLTGTLPANKIPKLATTPSKPGGNTTPILGEQEFFLKYAANLTERSKSFFREHL